MSRNLKLSALSAVATVLALTAFGFNQPASAHDHWQRHEAHKIERMERRAYRHNHYYNNYGGVVNPYVNGYSPYGYNGYNNGGVLGHMFNFLF